MNNRYRWGILVVLVILLVGLYWLISRPSTPGASQTATTTPSGATTTTPVASMGSPVSGGKTTSTSSGSTATSAGSSKFALASGEVIKTWNFQGAYTGNAQLTEKANVDIQKLKVLLNTGTFPNYDIYVGIASEYDLLGDGASEYTYLQKALAIDSAHTGLAWDNLASLLSKLGANASARVAYRNAILAQPIPQYAQDFYQFLLIKYPQDTADMTEAQKILVAAEPVTL